MPKLISQPPKYRRHSSRDLAFVGLAGRRVYLPGSYGSQESRTEYHRLCREWEAHGRTCYRPNYGRSFGRIRTVKI
jgi:hypothetical protein